MLCSYAQAAEKCVVSRLFFQGYTQAQPGQLAGGRPGWAVGLTMESQDSLPCS